MTSYLKKVLSNFSSLIPRGVKERIPKGFKNFLRSKYLSRTVVIDIVGSCNLRCPSCPNGNTPKKNPVGVMSLETFKKILEKLAKEQPGATVAFYNWGESFLHPRIAEFIKATHSHGLKSRLSTNLNLLPANLEEFASANPGGFTISLSGFTQKVYEIGHRGGNIETVKENMRKLSLALQKMKATTAVTVYFHKYLYNLREVELMKNFAESLGFSFGADWAYYMPIEKVKAYLEGKLSPAEVDFIENRLALDIKKVIKATAPFRDEPCSFPAALLTLDWRGEVQLCCGIYDSNRFSLGSYLETPLKIIEEKLKNHPFCRECQSRGLHIFISWQGHNKIRPLYEKIAQEKIKKL
jgi:MoaA/NifB/PqqE/SkfB family radical SAM enzyme